MKKKHVIGGLLIGGGILGLILISRRAGASEAEVLESRREAKISEATAACPEGDRDCVMRIRYAAMGRDWDYESSPDYRAASEAERRATEEARIRAAREERWSHL